MGKRDGKKKKNENEKRKTKNQNIITLTAYDYALYVLAGCTTNKSPRL